MEALWTPTAERAQRAEMTRFLRFAEAATGQRFNDYGALHRWSVTDVDAFWSLYVRFAGLRFSQAPERVKTDDPMPKTSWFPGATLNYAQQLLEPPGTDPTALAILALDEAGSERRLSFAELKLEVARCAAALQRQGLGEGDRVAAFIANVPEAVILLLACASQGIIFSSCSPDFGFEAALSRFGQIEPKLLVAVDSYRYNGRRFDTLETVKRLKESMPSLEEVVLVPLEEPSAGYRAWQDWLERQGAPEFRPLPFDHPLYILYSSGTTGLPKAIVHRAGGALLNHHKEHRLHGDILAGDRVMYFTTCGWMMWNWLLSALAQGAAIVLYEGSPSHPNLSTLWEIVDRHSVTHFGTSARFIHACKAAGLSPSASLAFRELRTIFSTGSPLSPAGFHWVYDAVKGDLHLASISGGTDIVGCFMLGDPTAPVYAGQIQVPGLGVHVAAFNEAGEAVYDEPGELVCLNPLPSMPLRFLNDPDDSRYKDAYFSHYDGVWRHGDLIEMRRGQGIIVYGRSDATLNPGGVRIGTAEIYRPLEALSEIAEALAVGKREDNDESIWLFVVLQEGSALDETLEGRIKEIIRQGASPRHVPKRILQVSGLPRTRSGKPMEIAVARLINGQGVPNLEVMANPEVMAEIAAKANKERA